MGNTYADGQKDTENEDNLFQSSSKSNELTDHHAMYVSVSKPWNLVKGAKPGRTLILKLIQPEAHDNWLQGLFVKLSHGGGIRIPKHLVSLDEKYFRQCLELMHMSASKGVPCALSVNLSSLDTELMSDCDTQSRRIYKTKYAIDYPMDVGCRDSVINPIDEEIVGSIMGSNSMMSMLRSPLFQRLGISDHELRFKGTSLFENKRCSPSDYQGSPHPSTFSPSQNPGKKVSSIRDQDYGSVPFQSSPVSISSGGQSVPTDQSSASSFYPSLSQGMVQCTWKDGIPHFAFSLDDQKELYVATAWKVEVTNNKALDYVYSFHLKPSGQNNPDIYDNCLDIIGKMRVSTSLSLCSNNSKIMETEFVLIGTNENHAREVHALPHNARRSRKLSKVMEVFKGGHSLKQRTPSIFGGTSAIPEDFSAENILEACTKLDQQIRPDLSERDFLPNLEMLAVIVKDHFQDETCQKEEVGGWGLKFLKKNEVKQHVASLDPCASSEYSLRSDGNCSTSIDIIVPAGPHGGPRTRNGGPTSLVERWRLGGHCDCGGWDIGCPLKILKARQRRKERWHSSEAPGECKSFDLFAEGSKQGTPTVKMVNIHENLYFISFQSSSLSALQCFSIVVAIVHSQHPTLQPKHVQD